MSNNLQSSQQYIRTRRKKVPPALNLVRATNLRLIIEKKFDGTQERFAEFIQRKACYISRLITGHRILGDDLVEYFEIKLGYKRGFFDIIHNELLFEQAIEENTLPLAEAQARREMYAAASEKENKAKEYKTRSKPKKQIDLPIPAQQPVEQSVNNTISCTSKTENIEKTDNNNVVIILVPNNSNYADYGEFIKHSQLLYKLTEEDRKKIFSYANFLAATH